jgi:transcriptional regulator NrdR family protein
MDCPRCNAPDSHVYDSRLRVSGAVWRRRKCRKCGARWTTTETLLELTREEVKSLKVARPVQ